MEAAVKHCIQGIGVWQWASNDQGIRAPMSIMACCGDVPTLETLAAVSILREHLPELKIRVVNVVDLMKLAAAKRASPRLERYATSMSSSPGKNMSSSLSTLTPG